ncbi:hypothetical protein ACFQ0M_44285 [Kitasatospora aburaviensis]
MAPRSGSTVTARRRALARPARRLRGRPRPSGPPGRRREPRTATALIAADGASGYELRLPDGAGNLRTTALDTVHGPARTAVVAAAAPATLCGAEYLPRAAWGADESKRFKNGVENSPPSTTRCRP